MIEEIQCFLFSPDKQQTFDGITVTKLNCVNGYDVLDVVNNSMDAQAFNHFTSLLKQRNLYGRVLRIINGVMVQPDTHFEECRPNKMMVEQRAGWH